MYDWEREALGIDTLGQIRGAIEVPMRVDLLTPSRSAWWIATLFGPDIWKTWRVGLLRGSVSAVVDRPIALPDPLVLRLPDYVAARTEAVQERWDCVAVVPAVVDDKALAFAACGIREQEEKADISLLRERWELVAPTDLVARLRLADGQQVSVRLLPATLHRPDAPHQR
jgi:hypothetical protein